MSKNALYNENELLRQVAAGDAAAFGALFALYKDKIYAISLRLSMSEAVAEDLVQEIFLKVWLNRDKLATVHFFRAYLYTLARHHIVRYLKRMARHRLVAGSEHVADPEVENLLLEKEYAAVIQEAISRLSPQQALVYRLSKQEGLKREEIAARLQLSPETVKVHLAQAMKQVRAFCLSRLDLVLLVCFMKK